VNARVLAELEKQCVIGIQLSCGLSSILERSLAIFENELMKSQKVRMRNGSRLHSHAFSPRLKNEAANEAVCVPSNVIGAT